MIYSYGSFYGNKFSNIGISKILKLFIHMVLFYGYRVLKMGMQRKCVSFYLYGSFSWL